jgi:hypothetical protein
MGADAAGASDPGKRGGAWNREDHGWPTILFTCATISDRGHANCPGRS